MNFWKVVSWNIWLTKQYTDIHLLFIITNVCDFNSYGKMYWIQLYVLYMSLTNEMYFGFLWVLQFSIDSLNHHDITEILLKVVLNINYLYINLV